MPERPNAMRAAPGCGSAWLRRLLVDPGSALPQRDADWEALLADARRAMMAATLALRLREAQRLAELPERPRLHLESAIRIGERLAHEVREETRRVAEALQRRGLPCVLLKGAAYQAAGLRAGQGRLFADVDLIVPRSRIVEAEHALFGAGWIPQETDAYNERYYREWMHEIPPLRHALRNTTLDLHHTITPPTSAFHVEGERLLGGVRSVAALPGVQVLQPEDMVLHSAVHLFAEGEFEHGLRDLWDMRQLMTEFAAADPGFWDRLLARAGELALAVPLHHALVHAERLFGLRAPSALAPLVAALSPGGLQAAAMRRLLATALEPTPIDTRGAAERLQRWLLYVRSHWLRMPPQLLLPHLVRKAWMRRFPKQPPAEAPLR